MAIKQTNGNSNTVYLEYSPTPGVLVISNEANRGILKEARELVGEDNWKGGFDGIGGSSNTSKARKFLAENGLPASTVLDGEIVAAYYSERQHEKGVYQDVRMKLLDQESGEGYLVTLPLQSTAGQMLIRKLANDAVERGVEISAFSVFPGTGRKDEASGRTFYDSAVQLKDAEGNEIKQALGIFEAAIEHVKAKMAVLRDSGVDDREVMSKARLSAMRNFYKEILVSKIEPKFPRENRSGENDEPVSRPVANPPATGGGFDEADDGVPF
jgi:hypothetical protein